MKGSLQWSIHFCFIHVLTEVTALVYLTKRNYILYIKTAMHF